MHARSARKLIVPTVLAVALVTTVAGCPDPHDGLDCQFVQDSSCTNSMTQPDGAVVNTGSSFYLPDGTSCQPHRPDPRCYS